VGNAKFQISSTNKTKLEIIVHLPLACKISKVGMGFTRGGGQFAHLDGFECKNLHTNIKIWAYFSENFQNHQTLYVEKSKKFRFKGNPNQTWGYVGKCINCEPIDHK
jgi:hypothetical protein